MPSSSSNNNSKPSGSKSENNQSSSGERKNDYAMVKEGWGSRTNFQYSYGLKMDPEGLAEGKAILDAFRKADEEEARNKGI